MPAIIVVGLAYGDEGKGTTVDYLTRLFGADTVVRFNGGPQAGHNVVLPSGVHHTFSQWGAGTLAGADTHLSGFCLISPWQALPEAAHLRKIGVPDPFAMVTVSPRCPVITPWHAMLNRMTERARGDDRHGTCGQGVGETMRALAAGHVIRAGQLMAGRALRRDLTAMRDLMAEQARSRLGSKVLEEKTEEAGHFTSRAMNAHVNTLRTYADLMRNRIQWLEMVEYGRGDRTIIFEGAQGVLLDQDADAFPHVTWSKCTTENADEMLRGYEGTVLRLGVMRTYMTRHGEGPFPTEAAELDAVLPEPHNDAAGWQGWFRRGYLDVRGLNRAINFCGNIDGLVVTHIDRGVPCNAPGGAEPGAHTASYFSGLFGKAVLLESRGPTHAHKKWNWKVPSQERKRA